MIRREKGHSLLPHDDDSERFVLSAMAIDPHGVIPKCIDAKVTRETFYAPRHGIIFDSILEIYDKHQRVDLLMLTHHLRKIDAIESIGGTGYITEIYTFTPTTYNVDYYIGVIIDKWTFRKVVEIGSSAATEAMSSSDGASEFLDQFEAKVCSIAEARTKNERFSIRETTLKAVDSIERLYERNGAVSGLSTGFSDVDKMLDGLHESEMIVIAARPSMGKTALGMNIAEHVALDQGRPVGVFSLEMSADQLIQRMIYSRSRVSSQRVREGYLSEKDFGNITSTANLIGSSQLLIDDTPGLSILELRGLARRWKREKGIELLLIDYLQLLRSTSKRGQDNRQIEISEISSGIKALAKELKIPIVVLAQLNRNPENRTGGKPRISDLRESGSIEQDADVVGLLTRSEYYADEEDRDSVAGKAELIIAKQRNGPIGEIPLTFIKQFARFENCAKSVDG